MTMHGDQSASQGDAALHHLIDGLTGNASRVECDLPTNCDHSRTTDTGQINDQAWPEQGRIDRWLGEAMQA